MSKITLNNAQIHDLLTQTQAMVEDTQAIYLYGSFAQGLARADSDIDIAILAKTPLTAELVWSLKSTIATQFGRDIDIVDLRQASTEFAFQIITDSQCLYGSDNTAVGLFEVSIMTRYADLQIERREIVADIVARGRVYGS